MKPSLIILCLFCSTISFAQKKKTAIYSCSYYGEKATLSRLDICFMNNSFAYGMNDDSRATQIVDNIVREVGLPRNFLIVECPEIKNCKAVNYLAETGSLRYIVYDDQFLKSLDTLSSTPADYWASISIMAHEIGHHLCGHTLDSLGSRPDKELEADAFSGFIMYKLGASLDQAQAAMKAITEKYGDADIVSTHPPLKNRLAAIRSGWNNGWSSNYRQQQNKNEKPSLISMDDIAMEVYNDAYLLNKTGKYKEAIQKCNTVINLKKNFADAYVQRGFAEANLKQSGNAMKTLDSALVIDPSNCLARVYKGKAMVNTRSFILADSYFFIALAKDSTCPALWAERALMFNEQNLYDKAIKDAEKALDLGYQDAHIPLSAIGYAYLKKKKYAMAVTYFSEALDYNPLHDFSRKWGIEAYKLMEAQEKKAKTPVKK
ncbi:MAG TPA: M48 family metalloprotease [Chitinophagaceae bacterium]